MTAEERQARDYLGLLFYDHNRRWNVEPGPDFIAYCHGYHEKEEGCYYEHVSWLGALLQEPTRHG